MSNRYKNGRRVLLDRMNLTPEGITVVDKSIQRIGDKAMVDINSQVAVTENSSGNPSKRASSEPPSSTLLLLSNLQKGLKGVTDHELKDLFEDVGKQRFVMLYRDMTSNRSISFDTAQPVHLTNTRKMLHRNFNGIVGVFKAAINMQKEFKL